MAMLPLVPAINKGIARRVALSPKMRLKRASDVGKTEDVPNPERAAPKLRVKAESAVNATAIPASMTIRLTSIDTFSLKNLKNTGAIPRPATNKTQKMNVGDKTRIEAA